MSAIEVMVKLGTDADKGLTSHDAAERLGRYGRNELAAAPPVPLWRSILAQFQDPLVILLLAAALVSAGMWLAEGDTSLPFEALAILVVVLLNALMSFVQQARAQQAVAALRRMSAAQANVIRDGGQRSVPTTDLVPGDILLIEEGSVVSADARLTACASLQMAEASLTGESEPVPKEIAAIAGDVGLGDRANMVFSGTAASYGRGQAVVTATAMQTEIGSIAGMLAALPDEATPLQQELVQVGKLLGIAVVGIAVVMVGTILLTTEVQGARALFGVLILGVALAVAAVPEGLPAVVTAVLSLGVHRLAQRRAIVRHLAALETLGSATVIASDKTGTLTRNEMTVRCIVTASGTVTVNGTGYAPVGGLLHEGASPEGALRSEVEAALLAGARANNAVLHEHGGIWTVLGDPTEGALLVAARKAGLDVAAERVGEVPFSSERKLMSTVHRDGSGGLTAYTKGALDVLLGRCTHEQVGTKSIALTPARRSAVLQGNEALAGTALRTLGVAYRVLPPDGAPFGEEGERDLVFLGLVGMIDPPRDEAKAAVARARGAGIRPLMITGDHPRTAAAIAHELGIAADAQVVTGAELAVMADDDLEQTVLKVSVYARVDPAHKLRIVQALQRGGATVAMTGDGVNDAPALKAADIGVAMGITGTDVSKEAADIVLADDNFATIVTAVEEGRAIYANIRKFLRYLLSSNFGEVMTMFFGVLLADRIGLSAPGGGVVLPLLATQILWLNLVTDVAPALALGVDPSDAGTMAQMPRPRGEGVITRRMWAGIAFVGAIMATGTLLVLDASLPGGLIEGSGSPRHAQTMALTTLMMFQLFNAFNARSDTASALRGLFANRWLWAAVGLSLLLHAALIYVPFLQQAFSTESLGVDDWLICLAVASSVLWLRELGKLAHRTVWPKADAVVARS